MHWTWPSRASSATRSRRMLSGTWLPSRMRSSEACGRPAPQWDAAALIGCRSDDADADAAGHSRRMAAAGLSTTAGAGAGNDGYLLRGREEAVAIYALR